MANTQTSLLPAWLPANLGHFIDGRFVSDLEPERFVVHAPASDTLLTELPSGGAVAVDAAVATAARALDGPWGQSTASERGQALRRLAQVLTDHAADLARLEALDTGKPISETMGGDIPRSAANCAFFADLAAHQGNLAVRGDDGAQHTTWREPLGIVGLITPWNLPLYLATWKLAPALAQGNAVILKPAELTPLSAAALGLLTLKAGIPPGVVNVVQGFGPGAAGEALVRHPQVKAISFTGETSTGTAIMAAAAPSLKKLSFELGGKGATVIFADADLDTAIATAARAAFRNQGQICLAGSRLLVQRPVYDQVVNGVLAAIRGIRLGDPLDPATTMGSLICQSHRDKVAAYVEKGRATPGAAVLCGGRRPPEFERGAYYEPTVIAGLKPDSVLIQEEIFGPVLTVQAFDDAEEALAMANGTPYGLSCSIWTQNIHTAQWAARQLKMGLVWVNCWFVRDLHTAFGGTKRSGVGREGGAWSLEFFSEPKTVTIGAGRF